VGRLTGTAAPRAQAVLALRDAARRPRVEQAAADALGFGRRPCLMVVEQHRLCWLTGRRAERRNGAAWAPEFWQVPHRRPLTRDAG
jgi:hypothetical protein